MAVYFVFIDGLGIGGNNEYNPLTRKGYSFFDAMAGGLSLTKSAEEVRSERHVFKHIDATLGVEGLPQSGTGQVSLFSGVNAPKHVGKHYGPFPHSATKELLSTMSVASRAATMGLSFEFMNAYPPIFFRLSSQRNRWSTTTLMCQQQSIPLHTEEDVRSGLAITAEITQEIWKERLGIDLPKINEQQAAERMLIAGRRNDIVMYEYYLTDKAGHAMDHGMAENVIARIDAFLSALVDGMGSDDLLLISSDHGNIEDLGVKTHTTNPVPLIALGNGADAFYDVLSIADVVPGLMKRFV
jgi:2,3-bisphosphoglycerate-independent phosphoglycerate mutase